MAGTAGPDGTTELHAVGCDPDERFRIASITKPMTAALAVRVLDVDAPTGIWPEDVRVRHLLSHTSGFGCENGDLARFGDGDDALGLAVAELPQVKRFLGVDEAWSYANTGYWLAGWLAGEATGETFEDALRHHVLGPAGMASADFDEPELSGSGRGATTDRYPRARRPSGGLVAEASDVIRFGRWQLSEPWTETQRQPLARPLGGVYGLGLFGERVAGADVWGHGGSYGGFQSTLLIVPSKGAVFVGLTSSGEGSRALRELEDLWFERLLGERRRVAEQIVLPEAALDAFAGTYANDETTAVVARSGGGLSVVVTEEAETLELWAPPIGERTFEVAGGPFEGSRLDFPVEGFARVGYRLAARVE
ncbi:MAG TPA: serine hydrolase domain-containing protein [Gaiellaceae bacterium]|nr:serine hydrolase domain-containing protein [Gaiellaceae bacterium]